MRPTVRRADDNDRPVLAARGFRSKEDHSIFVAHFGGEIVGTLSFAARPFESDILRLKTMHLHEIAVSQNELLHPLVARSLELLAEDGCKLVTSRRPETDREILSVLQLSGFRVIECLVNLSHSLEDGPPDLPRGITIAGSDDAEACAEVARAAFYFDRFHADPAIDNEAANSLKAQWARNCVRGRADRVFVTRNGRTVTGFNACLLNGDAAVIDLIGVAPNSQGKGLGRALTVSAIAYYAGKAARLTVGTQSCNTASLSLYQSAGFQISSSALTLHAHLS